jgi:hypothetical protein
MWARTSDFPRSFIPGLPPRRSLSGPPSDQLDGRAWDLPVLAHEDSVHAQVLRPRGAHRAARASAAGGVAFRLVGRRRHPEVVISRLHSWPARTPVNASLRPRGSPTHDLGPPWIATPSMSGVLIPFLMPVHPGAFPTDPTLASAADAVGQSRSGDQAQAGVLEASLRAGIVAAGASGTWPLNGPTITPLARAVPGLLGRVSKVIATR